jgi:hypothetical protein
MQETEQYVQYRDSAWYVDQSGIQIYSVIAMWQQGFAPEEIQHSFSMLSLQAIYGSILYYLEQRPERDAFFHEQNALFAQRKIEAEAKDQTFHTDMRERVAKFRTAQGSSDPITA